MKISINKHAVEAKVQDAFKKGLPVLTELIKDDCNLYCKWDEGTLAQSANIHSRPELGQVIWQTAYARRQYWEIKTAYTDKNPNASWKWCEVAKRKHLHQWQQQAQRLLEDNL